MQFVFDKKPEAKARPKMGKWGAYDPKYHIRKEYEKECQSKVASQGVLSPIEQAIGLDMTIYVPAPRHLKKSSLEAILGQPVIKRPDIDNYLKFYMDIFQNSLYADDKYVTDVSIRKRYALEGRVTIETNLVEICHHNTL